MKKHIIFLIILSSVIRLTALNKIPPALYSDETAIGYNAYSILKTGRDEWGNTWPVYFKSYGDYKLPLYIYLTAFFEKFLGLNELAVRLPSALAGILAVALFFLIVNHTTKNLTLAFLSAVLLSINPQHIFFSRAGFEVNLSLTLILAGVYLFFKFTKSKKTAFLLLSTIFFSLATYTYNISRLVSPLILLYLILDNKKTILKLNKQKLFAILTLNLILLFPFIKVFFSPLGVKTAKGEMIFTSPYVLAENIGLRANIIENLNPIAVKLFFNKYLFFAFKYFENLASIIDLNFFFVSGSHHPNHGTGRIGVLYLFELPLVFTGIIVGIKRFWSKSRFFFLWFFISYIVLALSRQVPHATRGFFLILPLEYLSALGGITLFQQIKKGHPSLKKRVILFSFFLFVLYNILYFSIIYTIVFPKEKAEAWGVNQKRLAEYISRNYEKYDRILIDEKAKVSYTALAFYLRLDPEKFQKTVERKKSGDLYTAIKFDKFEVKRIESEKDLHKGVLLILDGLANPSEGKITKIKLPKRHIALSLQDQIVQWPEEKTAFILVEKE